MLEPKLQGNGNKYKLVVEDSKVYVYRYSTKGTYKNVWENLLNARDIYVKQIKKDGYFRVEISNIEVLKQYAIDNGYGLEVK